MATPHTGEKGSIPVLAYLASENPLLLSSSLFIHHKANLNVATITLSIPLFLQGSANEHIFIVQYDPDNIQSATDAQGAADRHVTLSRLSLTSTATVHTLSLHLKDPCPLWCPRHQSLAPASGSEVAFGQLLQLALATDVHFVFNRAHMRHPHLLRSYLRFVNEPENLTGYQLQQRCTNKGLEQRDWRALALADGVPPAYVEISDKRPREVSGPRSTSSSPRHRSKKLREKSHKEPSQSDTEIASDNSYLDHQEYFFEQDDEFTHSIKDPTLVPASFHAKTVSPAPTDTNTGTPTGEKLLTMLRPEIVSAVKEVLPQVLDSLFPSLAFNIADTTANEGTATIQPISLRQAEKLLLPYIFERLRYFPRLPLFDTYIQTAIDDAESDRVAADIEFKDIVEDHRGSLLELSYDKLADLEREAGYHLDKVRRVKHELKRARRRAHRTIKTVDHDAKTAAIQARSAIQTTARNATHRVDAEVEASLTSASAHLDQMTRKRLRDAEATLDKMIAAKTGAWRRRIFICGKLRRKGHGLHGGRVQKSKTRQRGPEQLRSDSTATTEDEL